MTAAHQNPPTQKRLSLTAAQMATVVVLDMVGNGIASGVVILRDSIGAKDGAEMLLGVGLEFEKRKQALMRSWEQAIQVVGADALPVVPSKAR